MNKNVKKTAIMVLLLIFSISFGLVEGASIAAGYNVSGYVDNGSFRLDDVLVKATNENTAVTASNGYYSIPGLPNGTYNFSYNKTGYDTGYLKVNISGADVINPTKTLNKTATTPPLGAPNITGFSPPSPVSDITGATRMFSITVNQTVNVSWQINGVQVFSQNGITQSSYTNTSAALGTWSVTANAQNVNGTDSQKWDWTVTAPPPPPAYIPPQPSNLAASTAQGSFWINYTWQAGAGNVTDSYNVSVNGAWKNGTKDTSYNSNAGPHGFSNISVYAYNSSGAGRLSSPASLSKQVPNNPITLKNVQGSYSLNEGDTLYISPGYTDLDGDKGIFSTNADCLKNSKCTLNSSTGVLVWKTGAKDKGTYNWQITVEDGYGGSNSQDFTVTVSAYTPGKPSNLANTTDKTNFWVNYTWSKGENTDLFNVSVNGNWDNTSAATFRNVKSVPHGWVNISVAGYNSTSQALSDFASQNNRIPNNPITLTNVADSYTLFEGDTLYIYANYTDADYTDKGIFATNSNKTSIDPNTGVLVWKTQARDGGVYKWYINVTDGYSISAKEFTITVNAYIPGKPALNLSGQGNFWVNYTWSAGANTSSFNVSVNGTWDNGSATFKNTTTSPHGWVNISVAGYNATSQLMSDFVSQNVQIPNNPITLTNVSSSYFLYEGDTLYIKAEYNDVDKDRGNFTTTATKGTFDNSTGVLIWKPESGDGGVYEWQINVTDGYGSTSTQKFRVIVPLNFGLDFIEPGVINDNGTWVETWHSASVGHKGKFIGVDGFFKNTGKDSLKISVTDSPAIYCKDPCTVTLASNESKSFMQAFQGRRDFEINSDGFFNYTFNMSVTGYSGSTPTFNYDNSTSISLPLLPIYKMKRSNGDIAAIIAGGKTIITYTLEANSSVNLTNVSIYDPFYPENGGFFNLSEPLEANKPQNITYTYAATTADLSKFKCEGGYPCIINMATLTGNTSSGQITDSDFVRLFQVQVKPADNVYSSSGGGPSSGGGSPASSEDFNNIERREVREMDVYARSSSTYVFKDADPVMVVAFESSVSENGVPVLVEVLKGRSKLIGSDAPGNLYKYFNVYVGMSGFSKKVGNGVVVFRVNNSWLAENGFNPKDISLYKWMGDTWVEKSTEIAERKPNYTYYASYTGNFSSFAVIGNKKEPVETTSPASSDSAPMDEQNTTNASNNSNYTLSGIKGALFNSSTLGFNKLRMLAMIPEALILLTGIILATRYYIKNRNRKRTKSQIGYKEVFHEHNKNSGPDNSGTPASADRGGKGEFGVDQP